MIHLYGARRVGKFMETGRRVVVTMGRRKESWAVIVTGAQGFSFTRYSSEDAWW